jgi:hypothetical protein
MDDGFTRKIINLGKKTLMPLKAFAFEFTESVYRVLTLNGLARSPQTLCGDN